MQFKINSNHLLLLFIGLVFTFTSAQSQTDFEISEHYTKQEVMIPMRDGIKLHTTIYSPKNTEQSYPIIMTRTPYSSQPYGANKFPQSPSRMAGNPQLLEQGNIFVVQDVRGRYMSEGDYDNMRPFIPNKKDRETDEASDTYDTIDWLVNHVENNNGRVGIWGISYPGFYSTYALLSNHPALKAVSPQAPISDFFFDDFHHNGAYMLSYFVATGLFGQQFEPTTKPQFDFPKINTQDAYDFFLKHRPISTLDSLYPDNFFWEQLRDHPNYDAFWQSRNILPHLKDIKPAVMTVGGLFDAEDLRGPFATYQQIEKNSDNYNIVTYGPWSHGQWTSPEVRQSLGNIYFGDSISLKFQEQVITKFFNYFLKDEGDISDFPEARMYDTGLRKWDQYTEWPPREAEIQRFYLGEDQSLSDQSDASYKADFISDVNKPVPYSETQKIVFTPREYMTADQRFAARRPDVLTYETSELTEDVKWVGNIAAHLKVETTGTDADWIVKVIDVFPDDAKDYEETDKRLGMSNYHMMIRSEVMPARFRDGFETPKAMTPYKKTPIDFTLQGINHTFRKGHKIQIQIQSTWFPLINLNPQTFVPNLFKAKKESYQTQIHSVYGDSYIEFKTLK